jgi:hypothetical protein
MRLCGERKMLAPKHFGKLTNSPFRIYFGMLIYGQMVVGGITRIA